MPSVDTFGANGAAFEAFEAFETSVVVVVVVVDGTIVVVFAGVFVGEELRRTLVGISAWFFGKCLVL